VLAACVLVAAPAAAQLHNGLLDVFTVHVKSDKVAQFEAVSKKIVAASQKNKGGTWLAIEQVYGPGHTIRFVFPRADFATLEKGSEAFMAAMFKTYGQTATMQIFREGDSTMEESGSEIRRQHFELSANPPADAAALNKMVGESRWVQTTMVRLRPGQSAKFEEELTAIKAAREKAAAKETVLVSQALVGQRGSVYYISTFRKSLAEIDSATPLKDLLGEEGFATFLKTVSETVATTEHTIGRFRPDLSNVPEDVVQAAPDFWRPKPVVAKKGAGEQTPKATPAKQQ